jgi:hypothetical protein
MNKRIWAVLLGAGLMALVPGLGAQGNYKLVGGPEAAYFGHISLSDVRNDGRDAEIVREGSAVPELAVLNTPVGPGDTIRTTAGRRLEVQFDNATILRLDGATELKIGTILARSLSSDRRNVTALFLERGRIYVMYTEYDSRELFQVLTTVAAVKFRNCTIAGLAVTADGSTDVMVEYGKCDVMGGAPPMFGVEKTIGRDAGLRVYPNGAVAFAEYRPEPDFAAWNRSINDDFEALHAGLTPLPKPVLRMAKSVYYFARTFGNLHGEWISDEYLGTVWRPAENDHDPSGRWAPYVYGHWTMFGGRLYWVPDEVWGWVPYHLGIWHWDAKKGWLWVPGSAFAPAWVDWAICDGGYCLWSPMTIWDWAWDISLYDGLWRGSFAGLDGWESGEEWAGNGMLIRAPMSKVTKDQLKKPSRPALAMPEEFAKIRKSLVNGLEKREPGMLESVRGSLSHALIVRTGDLKAPNVREKASLLETVLAGQGISRPALGTVRRADPVESLPAQTAARPARESVLAPRFGLDWNPDVRSGYRLGLSVQYSGRTNEVICPEINISSRFADLSSNWFRNEPRRSSGGGGSSSGAAWDGPFARGGGSSDGASSASGSSGGSMSVSGTSAGSSSSGSASSENKTGSGGHIR